MIVSGRRIAIAEWKGTSDRSQINRKRSALGGALALPDHDHSSWTCSSERRSARPSRPSLTDSLTKSKRTTFSTHTGTRRSRPRWPAPLVEPGAVFTHLLALRRRRVALAGRGLVALGRRAPTQFDAVVGVVRHLESYRTVDHVAQCERPRGAVTARIRELARRQLGRDHALQFGLHLRNALVPRHRVPLGPPPDPIRKAKHHVDPVHQPQVARRVGKECRSRWSPYH